MDRMNVRMDKCMDRLIEHWGDGHILANVSGQMNRNTQ